MKIKPHFLIFICFFFSLVSCKKESESSEKAEIPDNIVVDLHSVSGNEFFIDEVREEFPIISFKNKYPDYYIDRLEKMKGIPELDSFMVVTKNFDLKPFIYTLYREGYISQDELLQRFYGNIEDTVNYFNYLKYQVNAVSGFLNDKQVMIIDTNGDNDFGDEKIHVFEKNFRLQPHRTEEKKDNSPIIDIEYQVKMGDKEFLMKRKMQIFPQVEHIHSYLFSDGTIDSLSNNYTLLMRLKDSRKGNLSVGVVDYSLALQGLYLSNLIIKPDSTEMGDSNIYFQKNFEYRIKDSLRLGNYSFEIDSISKDFAKLYLHRLTSVQALNGHRMGEKIADYNLLNLEEKNLKLYQILNNEKQYTLLDFWGTWCQPCIKILPDLKKLHQEYSGNVNFVSIALDDDINKVKTFTKANGMDWDHFFVNSAKRKGTVITGLEVSSYPTFILLDRDYKIMYRGGSESFESISEILKERT